MRSLFFSSLALGFLTGGLVMISGLRQLLILNMLLFGALSSANAVSVDDGINIPCLLDEGPNKGKPNVENYSCGRILKSCAETRKELQNQVRNILSWKIYGFYLGISIDADKTVDVSNPVGTSTAEPFCSVVGHTLQVGLTKNNSYFYYNRPVPTPTPSPSSSTPPATAAATPSWQEIKDIVFATRPNDRDPLGKRKSGDDIDNHKNRKSWLAPADGYDPMWDELLEIEKPFIGSKTSCGKLIPTLSKDGKNLTINLKDSSGLAWNAWVRGGMIWAIRRAAYDVFSLIPDDLTKLQDYALKDIDMLDEAGNVINVRETFQQKIKDQKAGNYSLDTLEVSECAVSPTVTLTCPASAGTPQVRLCNLIKMKTLLDSSIPQYIVVQIMDRAKFLHKLYFAGLFSPILPEEKWWDDFETNKNALENTFKAKITDGKEVGSMVSGMFYGKCGRVLSTFGITKARQQACAATCIFNEVMTTNGEDTISVGWDKHHNSCFGYIGLVNTPSSYSLVAAPSFKKDINLDVLENTYDLSGSVQKKVSWNDVWKTGLGLMMGGAVGGAVLANSVMKGPYNHNSATIAEKTLNYGFAAAVEKQTRVMCKQFNENRVEVNVPNLCDSACIKADPKNPYNPKDANCDGSVIPFGGIGANSLKLTAANRDELKKVAQKTEFEKNELDFVKNAYNPANHFANLNEKWSDRLMPVELDEQNRDKELKAWDIECKYYGSGKKVDLNFTYEKGGNSATTREYAMYISRKDVHLKYFPISATVDWEKDSEDNYTQNLLSVHLEAKKVYIGALNPEIASTEWDLKTLADNGLTGYEYPGNDEAYSFKFQNGNFPANFKCRLRGNR
jgi:hypothetical protein